MSTDWAEVEDLAREYVRLLEEEHFHAHDMDHHVMEAVLVVVFGPDIFERLDPLINRYDA